MSSSNNRRYFDSMSQRTVSVKPIQNASHTRCVEQLCRFKPTPAQCNWTRNWRRFTCTISFLSRCDENFAFISRQWYRRWISLISLFWSRNVYRFVKYPYLTTFLFIPIVNHIIFLVSTGRTIKMVSEKYFKSMCFFDLIKFVISEFLLSWEPR